MSCVYNQAVKIAIKVDIKVVDTKKEEVKKIVVQI
jgi:hypothetical protein